MNKNISGYRLNKIGYNSDTGRMRLELTLK